MYRFKGFEEKFNSQVKRRLIGTGNRMSNVSLAANVDGESVLMAARAGGAEGTPQNPDRAV